VEEVAPETLETITTEKKLETLRKIAINYFLPGEYINQRRQIEALSASMLLVTDVLGDLIKVKEEKRIIQI